MVIPEIIISVFYRNVRLNSFLKTKRPKNKENQIGEK